jgi:hypothetical protein
LRCFKINVHAMCGEKGRNMINLLKSLFCKKKKESGKVDSYIIIQHDDDHFEMKRNGFHKSYHKSLEEARKEKEKYMRWEQEYDSKCEMKKSKGYPKEVE